MQQEGAPEIRKSLAVNASQLVATIMSRVRGLPLDLQLSLEKT